MGISDDAQGDLAALLRKHKRITEKPTIRETVYGGGIPPSNSCLPVCYDPKATSHPVGF